MQSPFKIKLKSADAIGLMDVIEYIFSHIEDPEPTDMLLLAALAEVRILLKRKTIEFKKDYKVSLSPVQALSLKVMCRDYLIVDPRISLTSLQAKLMLICNEIDKQYQHHNFK